MVVLIHKNALLLSMHTFLGVMKIFSPLMASSSATAAGLTVTAIAITAILLVSNVTIIYAQQELASRPSAIENGIAAKTTVQSKIDSFRVQVPQGWGIQDVNNTGLMLGVEVLQGYGVLAQLCPMEEEQQQGAAAVPPTSGNTSTGSSSNSNNSCRVGQDEVIHIVRYPNLGATLGIDSDDIITNEETTADSILAYQMQKLQEVGYRDIRILNSTDTIINVVGTALNNSAIGTVPARQVEVTYSTNFAPTDIRRGYLLSTATDATARNLGLITGYAIFYEGGSEAAEIRPASGGLLPSPAVEQVFDSFELIIAPEVEQAILAAQAAQAAQPAEEAQAAEEELADPLTAEIDSNDTEGIAPTTFEFEANIAGGTEPYTIRWDLDDDGVVESNEETVVATFSEAGTYNVNLDVTDSQGQSASDSVEITVEEAPVENSSTVEQPATEETEETACDPSYPDMCIPPPPQNLTCDDIGARNFEVLPPDPNGFDGDNDGIGCESGSNQPDEEDEPDNSGSDSLNLDSLINRTIGGIL
jgi:PKD repeat protein